MAAHEFYSFPGKRGRNVLSLAIFLAIIALVLAGPSWAQTEPETTYKYEGNIESRKFHQKSCPYARVMAPFRKTKIETFDQAVAQGFSACRFCLAPYELSVEARIIHPDISR